jgi:hypothetical protein
MSSNKFALAESHGQLHGEIKTTAVTVSGGPTLLPAVSLAGRKDVTLYNAGSIVVYLGGADVSVSDGIPLAAGAQYNIPAGRVVIYGVSSGADQVLNVFEVS